MYILKFSLFPSLIHFGLLFLFAVLDTYEGETLELTGILRQEMGTYLCIASSSVPPRVSKRYTVSVHCRYRSLCKPSILPPSPTCPTC